VISFGAEANKMEHIDFIGIAGLIVALIALLVAVYGIRDVREQVRLLVGLQRNLVWAKLLHTAVWRFVDPTADAPGYQTMQEMHQFTMLVRLLEPKETLDSAQTMAYNEMLSVAVDLVGNGIATWKPDMDENVIRQMAKDWQSEKNSKRVKSMLGKQHGSIL
jgi:hypothetical protein